VLLSLPAVAGVECAHDPCAQGAVLDPGCDACVADVCDANLSCCEIRWNFPCASAVDPVCSRACLPICGDANDDRHFTATDALIALKSAVGGEPCVHTRCDFNGDGKISAPDALLILKLAVASPVTPSCPALVQYVLSELHLPLNQQQAADFAFNLDDDVQGHKDNAFGQVLAVLSGSAGLDFQSPVDSAIAGGATIELASLAADNLVNSFSATWRFFEGEPTATPPILAGGGFFRVAAGGVMAQELEGAIVATHLDAELPEGSPASLPIALTLIEGQPPIEFSLIAAHVSAFVTSTGCTGGRLGGAIRAEDLETGFLPAWATAIDQSIASDCRPGAAKGDYSMCDATSATYLQLFDSAPRDGHITLDEVRDDDFIEVLLTPDVDLLDENGRYAPKVDGVNDSLSFAIGFDCASASFTE
jgi:hypothetical protein